MEQCWCGFDKVCDCLTGRTFDSFLSTNVAVIQKHPDIKAVASAKQWFQDELFKKPNRVVHRGVIDYQQQEAATCVELARTLLEVFEQVDKIRYAKLMSRLQ
jgi:hypothetical protein